MRSRVEPGGWQANRVAVGSAVWSMIYIASGVTTSVPVTVDEPPVGRW